MSARGAEIYRQLRALANEGVAIMFASSDTQEVIGLADRIATFYHGQMVPPWTPHRRP